MVLLRQFGVKRGWGGVRVGTVKGKGEGVIEGHG